MEKLIIKDNFFKNPDELRKIALSTSYKTPEEVSDPDENWKGFRSDELKTLDRKIVLNSMILKWDNIKEEFSKLIKI